MAEQNAPEQADRWDALDQALIELNEGAMVLEELDGFIAGLLVCPELISPGEWFARAVGLSEGQPSPFADLDHANDVLALVMDYYNNIVLTLVDHPEDYSPLLSVDPNGGDVIWELWIEGFAAAVELRPESWDSILNGGGEAAAAMTAMMTLIEAACCDPPNWDACEMLGKTAPQTIVNSVVILHEHRLAHQKTSGTAYQPNPFAGAPKVGRNDPCPCGSGKKFKRCCGLN
jgi:uncharacterized protein